TPIQGNRGMPDLVIVGPGGVLYPELKSASGSLDADQRRWRDALLAAGQRWRLYRPEHWLAGEIERDLKALAKGDNHA
ncbi:MAG TPA: hypothetical protein VGW74_02675, partial [Propionibacteriaceae bacterium]|nr:hypothetical protein [Propionibacteriaceae bacterium]